MLVLAGVSVNSQTITTQTFGTGANAFSIEFVEIGNPGNAADTTGAPNPVGQVDYIYNLGKYEISRDQIEKASSAGCLGITLHPMDIIGGSRFYSNMGDRPATGVNWFEAAKFVNWLNTSTGGTAAYKFDGSGNMQLWSPGDVGYNSGNLFRNANAKFVIPTADEWYKGAYGSLDGTWWNYPNGSNSKPSAVSGGTLLNTAVYGQPDSMGPQVYLVQMVPRAHLVLQVWVLQVQVALQAHPVLQEKQVRVVLQELQVHQVLQVQVEVQAHLALQEQMELQAHLVLQVLVLQAQVVLQEHQALQEKLVQAVLREQVEPQALPEIS